MFKPVSPKVDFPKLEQEILDYWKKNKIFEKSIESRPPDKCWTFLDGPPFVTGMPHYGSLLSSMPKDLFGRYWTMKGYRVRRVWGWDGHGLPVENKVEEKLGIKSKKEIEERVGVKKFIDECKKYVNQTSAEWEWYIDHIGRWVDFKNAYRTWDRDYMESVLWVFKQMYDKGYIYKGLRVGPYCPHCATPISNFEIALDNSYKEVPDRATTYKYKLKDEEDTNILAWSTTPWNKIVTPALAVNPKLTYIKIRQGDEVYILAKAAIKILKGTYKILDEFKGKNLLGRKFEPHYDYYKIEPGEKAFEIIGGDFVTADEGTGVVTIAVYGEEDLVAMKEQNIHIEIHLDEEGNIKPDVPKFGGMYYLKANKAVNEDLSSRGLIYREETLTHNIPVCWRCETRLYYAPLNAWFVDIQKLKPLMKKNNEKVNWFPRHLKHGRFLKSIESAPDWNISRNRYWGSPVPVWECEKCQERFVPGSIAELEEASSSKISDLHKPEIDEVIVKCKKCGSNSIRTPEVLDSWIEAGSASFAERHFPFNSGEDFSDFFPPDYIAEYTGQIRAWFYVLHVIGAALYQSPAFKNVSVTGVILGNDGRKMSKNYGNYPDPKMMLETYGGDALRLYLMGSPVMKGEDILISEEQYKMQVRGTLLILWNVYNFFVSYANVDNWTVNNQKQTANSQIILDRWILSLTNRLIIEVTGALDSYDTVSAISKIQEFVNNLSTWYIRRSRDRVGPSAEDNGDKNLFYETIVEVLITLSKLFAPIAPFISEEIFRNLTCEESVHLTDWPEAEKSLINKEIEENMTYSRKLVEQVHTHRKEQGIRVRQPLNSLATISPVNFNTVGTASLIQDEVNVKRIDVKHGDNVELIKLDTQQTPKLKEEGRSRDLIREIQEERKKLGTNLDEWVNVELPDWPESFEQKIKREALVDRLTKADKFRVLRKNNA
ncbi:MAG: isoleucine--tRNA ligase [Candidatus Levybacteria bacterium]|nr:isoleucine--tRNA ligase [Candidatus Levybacteria bacterium]